MFVTQISVFLSNLTGRLAEIISIIAGAGVDIRALSLADTSDYGVLRMIVDKPEVAEEVLKTAGITVRETQVIAAQLEDKPGALSQVLNVLNDAGEPVLYAYAFISPIGNGACVILRTENRENTAAILKAQGVRLLNPEEMHG